MSRTSPSAAGSVSPRCGACGLCAVRQLCGFESPRAFHCSLFGMAVEPWDGCTFGDPGEPFPAAEAFDVDISAHAAVGGERWAESSRLEASRRREKPTGGGRGELPDQGSTEP